MRATLRTLRLVRTLVRRNPQRLITTALVAGGGSVLAALAAIWLGEEALRRTGGAQLGAWLGCVLLGLTTLSCALLLWWALRALFHHHEEGRRVRSLGVVLGASALIGVLAGLGAIVFFVMLEGAKHLLLEGLAHWHPTHPAGETPLFGQGTGELLPWVLFLLPALGGLVSGFIVCRWAPEAEGHGTDAAIDAYHHAQGKIRARVPLVKAISSAITIGTGGSAGREGPIAQIGAGIASVLGQKLNLARRDRGVLMAAGLAGGVGAIFHAPLAGAIFASEVMYRELDLEHEVIVPSFISSTVAYSVFSLAFGWRPLLETPDFVFDNPFQLPFYLLLALAVAAGATLFIRMFYGTRDAFKRLPIPASLKPALGGLIVGLLGLAAWQTGLLSPGEGLLGSGYGVIQRAFFDPASIGIAALLLVAVGKMATTAFSIGSGGSGGVFGPAIVIGGALGGAVGLIAQELFPAAGIHPGAFVMVGMAGFFAAAGRTPLSTIIMVGEMTGNHNLLVPSMLVCVVAPLLVGRLTIFENQLSSRLDAPSKAGNMMAAVLGRIPVEAALAGRETQELVTVSKNTSLKTLLVHFAECDQDCYPMLDEEGLLCGVVDGRAIRYALADDVMTDLTLAIDLAAEPVSLKLTDTLLDAVQRMAAAGREELVVVDPEAPRRAVGTLNHGDVLASYNRELADRLSPDED